MRLDDGLMYQRGRSYLPHPCKLSVCAFFNALIKHVAPSGVGAGHPGKRFQGSRQDVAAGPI